MIKYDLPLSDFNWLNMLEKAKGLDTGEIYNNAAAVTWFLEAIAALESEK